MPDLEGHQRRRREACPMLRNVSQHGRRSVSGGGFSAGPRHALSEAPSARRRWALAYALADRMMVGAIPIARHRADLLDAGVGVHDLGAAVPAAEHRAPVSQADHESADVRLGVREGVVQPDAGLVGGGDEDPAVGQEDRAEVGSRAWTGVGRKFRHR